MENYAGIVVRGDARNITITGCTVDGVKIPDFNSNRPPSRRWHCPECNVYGSGRDFMRTHNSAGDHGRPPAPIPAAGRRADRRPRSAWLTLWAIVHRTRTALARYMGSRPGSIPDALAVIGGAVAGVLLALGFGWLQHIGAI